MNLFRTTLLAAALGAAFLAGGCSSLPDGGECHRLRDAGAADGPRVLCVVALVRAHRRAALLEVA